MSSSSAAKSKVFLFGCTGSVGQSVLHALTSPSLPYQSHFELTALVRPETLESKDEKKSAGVSKLKAAGVQVVTGDAVKADAAEIAKWITGHDIVVSALATFAPGESIEFKILEAVKTAKIAWFIPALYGIDLSKAETQHMPFVTSKKGLVPAIKAVEGLNSFFVLNYVFMEYLINPWCGIDVANATVYAPYSLDSKISTTAIKDVGHLIVEALLQRNEPHVKNQILYFTGDTVTYNDIAHLLEEQFKKTFQKVVVTKEETEAAVAADASFQNRPARFRTVIGAQKGVFLEEKESWNAKYAKHVKMTTVKDFIQHL